MYILSYYLLKWIQGVFDWFRSECISVFVKYYSIAWVDSIRLFVVQHVIWLLTVSVFVILPFTFDYFYITYNCSSSFSCL